MEHDPRAMQQRKNAENGAPIDVHPSEGCGELHTIACVEPETAQDGQRHPGHRRGAGDRRRVDPAAFDSQAVETVDNCGPPNNVADGGHG